MKLYLVELRGSFNMLNTKKVYYGKSYVVANNSDEAVKKVQEYLEKAPIVSSKIDREVEKITLLAECGDEPNCQHILFL